MRSSILRPLATQRKASEPLKVRYNEELRAAEVFEDGRWLVSWDAKAPHETKKCDHETGEDQKGS